MTSTSTVRAGGGTAAGEYADGEEGDEGEAGEEGVVAGVAEEPGQDAVQGEPVHEPQEGVEGPHHLERGGDIGEGNGAMPCAGGGGDSESARRGIRLITFLRCRD